MDSPPWTLCGFAVNFEKVIVINTRNIIYANAKETRKTKGNSSQKKKKAFLDVLFLPLHFPSQRDALRGGKSKDEEEKSPTFVKAGTFDSSSNIL